MAILLGVHEKTTTSATRATEYPGHAATRIFSANVMTTPQNLIRKINNQCADTWASGHTAVWSFKPAPRKVADGTWKEPVQELAAHLRDHTHDKPTIVAIWHEPENDTGHWFADPEEFVTMFNTVHGWLTDEHPGVTTCHAAMAYAYRDKAMDDREAARWRTRARLNALDAYSGRSFPLATTLPELSGYARWRRTVAARHTRWGITERGWTCTPENSALRARTIAREFRWLARQQQPPELYLVWGSSGVEQDPGLRLDTAARNAIRAGFALLAR